MNNKERWYPGKILERATTRRGRLLPKRVEPVEMEEAQIEEPTSDIPAYEIKLKPQSGRSFTGQSDESYCLECVTPDTKLYTGHSVYAMGDLSERYTVLDRMGEHHEITQKFSRVYDGDLVKLTSWYLNIPLRITPEHPVLGVRSVRSPQSTWQQRFDGGILEWIPAGELTNSDFIAFPRVRKVTDVGIVTEDLAELIGWYLAEGSCTKQARGYLVEFSLGKHESIHVQKIVSLLKSCFGYDASVSEKDTALVVQFSSLIFGKFFEQFGTASWKKQLPQWVLELPHKKQGRLLRGMILGDGDITKGSIRYATTSERLAYEVRLLLFRLGIFHGIHRNRTKGGSIKGRKIMPKHDAWLFTIGGGSANRLAELTEIGFKAKIDKNWGWMREDFALIPIRKTELEHYKGVVQNLHVPPHESYVTLHGVLHNCVEGHTMIALTEMRHAIDRYRTANSMTPGVTEKVRVAIQELQGIEEDARNTTNAAPVVKSGIDQILNDVRWVRKEYGVSGVGLTMGLGSEQDLVNLRDRIQNMQNEAYELVKLCPTCNKKIQNAISRALKDRIETVG